MDGLWLSNCLEYLLFMFVLFKMGMYDYREILLWFVTDWAIT